MGFSETMFGRGGESSSDTESHSGSRLQQLEQSPEAKEALQTLEQAGRLFRWEKADNKTLLLQKIKSFIPKDINFTPAEPDLRVRHVVKERIHYYIIFNEGQEHISFRLTALAKGQRYLLDPQTGQQNAVNADMLLQMRPHELKVIKIVSS